MTTVSINLSPAASAKLDEARCRLTCLVGRFWRMVLTEDERQRLGGSLATAFPLGVVGMWQKLHGCSEPRAVIEAITALEMLSQHERKWLIEEIGEAEDDVEAAIETAAKTTELVLVERPPRVFWRGEPVNINWRRCKSLWNYFWELASHSKRGEGIDSTMFGEEVDEKFVIKKKHDLTKLNDFPGSLEAKIVSAGRGTQKLDLPPEQIQLFEIVTTESLRPRIR